jgi:hypothetical protein
MPLGTFDVALAWAGYACLVKSDRRELPSYFIPCVKLLTTDIVLSSLKRLILKNVVVENIEQQLPRNYPSYPSEPWH